MSYFLLVINYSPMYFNQSWICSQFLPITNELDIIHQPLNTSTPNYIIQYRTAFIPRSGTRLSQGQQISYIIQIVQVCQDTQQFQVLIFKKNFKYIQQYCTMYMDHYKNFRARMFFHLSIFTRCINPNRYMAYTVISRTCCSKCSQTLFCT